MIKKIYYKKKGSQKKQHYGSSRQIGLCFFGLSAEIFKRQIINACIEQVARRNRH